MRLYKCVNNYIENDDDILVFYADNEQAAREKIAEIRSKDECYRFNLFSDEDKIIKSLSKHIDIDDVAKKVYLDVSIDNWTLEEELDIDGFDAYVASKRDISDPRDVQVILVNTDYKGNVEDVIYDNMASKVSEESGFRWYISNNSMNSSLLEYFIGNLLDYNEEYEKPIPMIINKFDGDLVKANEYVEEKMIENIDKFFGECRDLADEYKNHLKRGNEENCLLSDNVYKYVAKKMLMDGEWANLTIRKIKK